MTNRIDRHPLTEELTLVTPNRLARPNALLDRERSDDCPFCPGNEDETPPEIDRVDTADGWLIRVVPNKYPIAGSAVGIAGAHEVIIESPRHDDELRSMGFDHVRSILDVWLRRMDHVSSLEGVRSVLLFRNRGAHAGESIRHPHTQLLAIGEIPGRIMAQSFTRDSCPLCRVDSDLEIAANDSFLILSAAGARFPYQSWIVPRTHSPSPTMSSTERADLVRMIQSIESALHDELGDVSVNWNLVRGPVGESDFHWYLEISPRVTGVAGLEIATGWFVNLVPPERAAEVLRQRIVLLDR